MNNFRQQLFQDFNILWVAINFPSDLIDSFSIGDEVFDCSMFWVLDHHDRNYKGKLKLFDKSNVFKFHQATNLSSTA